MEAKLAVGGFLTKVPRMTPAKVVALLAAMLGAIVALGLAAAPASAETFSNTDGPITISSTQSAFCENVVATPYPSVISVPDIGSSVTDVNVTLSGLSHGWPDDIDLLLVSPTGQSVILMADSGGASQFRVSGINVTFDDAASETVPDNTALVSGSSYRPGRGTPTGFNDCDVPASFPLDAPAGPYGTSLSVFNGTNPEGDWQLYVIDDTRLESGSITGWSLDINNNAPVANVDFYSVAEDGTLSKDAAAGVLSNDTDTDGDNLTASKVAGSGPSHGTLTFNADGSFDYTPDANYNGSDEFTYKANDGTTDSNVAKVNITVTPVNDAPSFTKGADQTVNMNAGAQSVFPWATNISKGADNENGQTLSFEVTNDNNNLFSTQPSIAPNGTLTYTPAPNASGSAMVSVTLKDNGGGQDTSATQMFTINVTAPTKVLCKKGGWSKFGFPDQGTCITFVNENR
jgi:VCBS repeat-containing protein